MIRCIAKRPWLLIVAAFLLLVSVWACFIYTAVTYGPASFTLNSEPISIHAGH